jgi:hypothetical protein
MTVAELLRELANEVVKGRSKWDVDVSIYKKDPAPEESLRDFGHSQAISGNTEHKKIYILGIARDSVTGEL